MGNIFLNIFPKLLQNFFHSSADFVIYSMQSSTLTIFWIESKLINNRCKIFFTNKHENADLFIYTLMIIEKIKVPSFKN